MKRNINYQIFTNIISLRKLKMRTSGNMKRIRKVKIQCRIFIQKYFSLTLFITNYVLIQTLFFDKVSVIIQEFIESG